MPITVNGTSYLTMGDAAFADNLFGTDFDIAAGYLDAPNELNKWSKADWQSAPGMKLPIWVGGYGGKPEAEACLKQLKSLGVPQGKLVALDMEGRIDKTYVAAFGAIMQHRGYKVWVYGEASTVFNNPQLNGYWVADYAGIGPFMYSHKATRATQWTDGAKFDQSVVKEWEQDNFWK